VRNYVASQTRSFRKLENLVDRDKDNRSGGKSSEFDSTENRVQKARRETMARRRVEASSTSLRFEEAGFTLGLQPAGTTNCRHSVSEQGAAQWLRSIDRIRSLRLVGLHTIRSRSIYIVPHIRGFVFTGILRNEEILVILSTS
jgi:hypothetical protein